MYHLDKNPFTSGLEDFELMLYVCVRALSSTLNLNHRLLMPHFLTILNVNKLKTLVMVTLCCNVFLDSSEKLWKYQNQRAELKKLLVIMITYFGSN